MAYEKVSKYRDMVYRCNTCRRCPRGPWDPNQPDKLATPVKQCPSYEANYTLASASQGMILIIRDLLEGKLEATPELVDHMYECVLCRSCNAVCEGMDSIPLGGIQGADIFRELRADFIDMGLEPPKGLKKFCENIAEKHNRQGSDKDRNAWAESLDVKNSGEIMLFLGCTASYADQEIAKSMVKVLKAAGADFGILEDEWCCGAIQYETGMDDAFAATAKHNVEALKAAGAKKVVCVCADCFKALAFDYPKYVGELGFEVVHSSELVKEYLEAGKLTLKPVANLGKVTYNDPCFLVRSGKRGDKKVIEEPRAVIKAATGAAPAEMEGYGKYTYCCGRSIMAPAALKSYQVAGKGRIGDAAEIGADTIITGCANCKGSLKSAAGKEGKEIRVISLEELVASAL
ncbi:MAG: (Fe-S)-binding protein [Mogibacterium sp.]|nr:(Fe-S)-binding protein [Mogibacterium sp.]